MVRATSAKYLHIMLVQELLECLEYTLEPKFVQESCLTRVSAQSPLSFGWKAGSKEDLRFLRQRIGSTVGCRQKSMLSLRLHRLGRDGIFRPWLLSMH
jgi:hypothetical protein